MSKRVGKDSVFLGLAWQLLRNHRPSFFFYSDQPNLSKNFRDGEVDICMVEELRSRNFSSRSWSPSRKPRRQSWRLYSSRRQGCCPPPLTYNIIPSSIIILIINNQDPCYNHIYHHHNLEYWVIFTAMCVFLSECCVSHPPCILAASSSNILLPLLLPLLILLLLFNICVFSLYWWDILSIGWCYYPATARYFVFFQIRHFSVSISIALVALVVCTLYHNFHYHNYHQSCHIYLYHNAHNELSMARLQTRSNLTQSYQDILPYKDHGQRKRRQFQTKQTYWSFVVMVRFTVLRQRI